MAKKKKEETEKSEAGSGMYYAEGPRKFNNADRMQDMMLKIRKLNIEIRDQKRARKSRL